MPLYKLKGEDLLDVKVLKQFRLASIHVLEHLSSSKDTAIAVAAISEIIRREGDVFVIQDSDSVTIYDEDVNLHDVLGFDKKSHY